MSRSSVQASRSRLVPNGRRIGPLLDRGRNVGWNWKVVILRIIRRPARRRDFQNAAVVECALLGIELRIFPDGDQFRRSDGVGPRRIRDIDRIANGRHFAISPRLAVAGPHHVVDLLVGFALVVQPALDDLVRQDPHPSARPFHNRRRQGCGSWHPIQ
jgi:hypothetical protein